MVEEQRFVRYQPDQTFDFDGLVRHAAAEHLDLTRSRRRNPHQHANCGRLSGAIRAEKAEETTARNLERQAVHRGVIAVNFPQVADCNRGRFGHTRILSWRQGRPVCFK